MNIAIANDRRSDILKVDSINSSDADFMITHVPFKSICVKKNLILDQREHFSEDEVYSLFFGDSDVYNKHQLIIVEGASGSGKSHFIRWLNAKLQTFVEEGKDVVLLIRRSDNTLKGTIKQLLTIDEISNIKNKDAYDRLVQANQTISEAKFKEKIYSEFIVEINTSEDNNDLSNVQKKQLVALLNNDKFKNRMMAIAGPIDRIYQKVAGTDSGVIAGVDALFEESDFTLDIEFNQELSDADRKAVMLANRLIPDEYNDSLAKPVTKFMNSFVDEVVRSCAGIEEGDFLSIFKEIRQELYRQNKNLILLIEDITAFTGINQDLLNALIIDHTGLNDADNLCRLISVVGTTTQYYSEFRDNYRDRITSQITIEDGAIGTNNRDVVAFCARYLNALSLSKTTIQEWRNDGANEENYPVHTADFEWESFNLNGKRINLYPFTQKAIENLYQNMTVQKTPRYIIKEIIEPAINDVIANKGLFPLFLEKWHRSLHENQESKILDALSRMENVKGNNKYKSCILSLIYYWGDGTFDIDSTKGTISGIRNAIFVKFGLGDFSKFLLGNGEWKNEIPIEELDDISLPVLPEYPQPIIEKVNKKYDDFKKTVNDWFYDKKTFNKAREIRDALCSFVFDTLNWQQLGVSIAVCDLLKNSSTLKLFSIERQDRVNARGLIEIKANEENKDVLLAIGKYLYIGEKKWDFKDAPSAIYTLTCWLEEHKNEIIDEVLEEACAVPTYIQCALLSDIIFLCLNDGGIKKTSEITEDKFLRDFAKNQGDYSAHSSGWRSLATICNNDNAAIDNHRLVLDYFNIVQGSRVTTNFINHTALESALKILEKNKYQIDFSSMTISEVTDKKKAIEYCKKLYNRIDNVIKEESAYVDGKLNTLFEFFGYDKDVEIVASDIRDLLTDIIEFYNKVDIYGLTIVQHRSPKAKELKEKSAEIAKLLSLINGEISDNNALSYIMKHSGSPMKLVNELVEFLSSVNTDVDTVLPRMNDEKDRLVRSGGWTEDEDPRFGPALTQFEQMRKVD